MGGTLFIFLITTIHVSLLLNSVIAVNPKKRFRIKMIHIDSKESPLYQGDHLTPDDRLQRLVKQSKTKARHIESQILLRSNATRSMNPDAARFPVVYDARSFYVAMVGLGTFPGEQKTFMNYYLMIDTGSDQTWLQCEGAAKTFKQDMPLYPAKSSTTFRIVPCNTHPLCTGDRCTKDGDCTYKTSYAGGSVTYGVVAEEKFTLGSDTGGFERIQLRMGCGLVQQNFEKDWGKNHQYGKPDLIAGILGLGSGQWSFLNQLGAYGQGKFSYCLEAYNKKIEGSDTYLRFGADATIGHGGQEVHQTPIVVPEQFQTSLYYLNLEDISVGNKKIGFPRGTFELKIQGTCGCIIDSGTPISMMYKGHFDKVADLVKAHFNGLRVEYVGKRYNYEACFRVPRKFDTANFPSITLHFEKANYVISDYKANFVTLDFETVCLAIFTTDTNTMPFVLGAFQQINKRILYNVMDQSLSFADEYCELGS
ncbi:aspartic proteinase nepenthesin-2-like [Papaver somniferum]|uniref:aspartic proteinase nepenthesin-2-like n=1 Tax=Papaver somniferum TaxID=3469 RepID=UPI000E6F6446|nr:aspartic proteinase nepenthesin-2-like [Papaver somniferum]